MVSLLIVTTAGIGDIGHHGPARGVAGVGTTQLKSVRVVEIDFILAHRRDKAYNLCTSYTFFNTLDLYRHW